MKIIFRYSLGLILALAGLPAAHGQVDSSARPLGSPVVGLDSSRLQVAIFIPLYLDSAFDDSGNYRYDKNFPKWITPGLEFYEGVQMALDSLQKEGAKLNVQIYDSKSVTQPMAQVVASPAFERTGLIIGQVSNATELQTLSAAAARKSIPFINVSYPNDGGVTNNPNLVILNSTLRTHCEAIYRYIQKNYLTRSLVFFRKKGTQEDRLYSYFTNMDKTTAGVPLKIKYVQLEDNFDANAIAPYLDSLLVTVCIAGSLDDSWGAHLCEVLAGLKSYRTTVIGMPTWDNIDFTKSEYAGEDVVYTAPFYFNPADSLVKELQQNFKARYYLRPSDMLYRGYEAAYRFSRLLLLHGKSLNGSIGEKKFKVFDDFSIEPVFLNKQTMVLDYFENKKLYFIKKVDGNVTTVN